MTSRGAQRASADTRRRDLPPQLTPFVDREKPLAIELAAPWMAALTPGELLGHLSDRLELLVAGEHATTARHASLWAALDSSYEALDDGEKALFRRLGLFAGTWNLDSMTSVCEVERGVGLRLLRRLVDRSLVTVLMPAAGLSRYRLLEVLRDYALARLRASEDHLLALNRFVEHFVGLSESATAAITAPRSPVAERGDRLRPGRGGAAGAVAADAAQTSLLTRRQLEVARLVVQGLSNKETAPPPRDRLSKDQYRNRYLSR